MPRRGIESTCERTRAGRACEGHGERTGRRVRCSSTRAPRLTLTRGCRRGCGRGIRPEVCLPRSADVSNLQQEGRQRTCTAMARMATMATPKLKLEKKNKAERRWGDNEPTNKNPSEILLRGWLPRVAMVAMMATSQKSTKSQASVRARCRSIATRRVGESRTLLHSACTASSCTGHGCRSVLMSWPPWPRWPPLN